jgi:hypothetical protein
MSIELYKIILMILIVTSFALTLTRAHSNALSIYMITITVFFLGQIIYPMTHLILLNVLLIIPIFTFSQKTTFSEQKESFKKAQYNMFMNRSKNKKNEKMPWYKWAYKSWIGRTIILFLICNSVLAIIAFNNASNM